MSTALSDEHGNSRAEEERNRTRRYTLKTHNSGDRRSRDQRLAARQSQRTVLFAARRLWRGEGVVQDLRQSTLDRAASEEKRFPFRGWEPTVAVLVPAETCMAEGGLVSSFRARITMVLTPRMVAQSV